MDVDPILARLRDDDRVLLVYLFGSTARGELRPASDLDVGVLLDRKLGWNEEREFRGSLADVDGGKLDLVLLRDAGVVLRHEVATAGRCLWARDARVQAEFEIQAISQYLDFQPILRLQNEYLRARVEERRSGPSR